MGEKKYPPGTLRMMYYCRDGDTREEDEIIRHEMALYARAWVSKRFKHLGVRVDPEKLLKVLQDMSVYTIRIRAGYTYIDFVINIDKVLQALDPHPDIFEIPQEVWERDRAAYREWKKKREVLEILE